MFTSKELSKMLRKPAAKPAKKAAAKKPVAKKAPAIKQAKIQPIATADVRPVLSDEDGDFVPIGLNGILASTEKLLAVNRGLTEPDERDSYAFKRVFSVDRHLGERIRLDAGKIRKGLMRNAAKLKSLRGAYPSMFDSYGHGLVIGDPNKANPLSAPIEEINPMHIIEQARRISQMGPGGIGSSEAITEDAQAIHPSQFGFVDPIAGPESERIGIDTRLAMGTRIGTDGRIYQQFRNRRNRQTEWLTPEDIEGKTISLPQ